MRAKTILILAVFLTLPAAAQDTPKAKTQCNFPDGKTIGITHVSEQAGSTEFATNENLVTVKAIRCSRRGLHRFARERLS
jgi:hypothetical protein